MISFAPDDLACFLEQDDGKPVTMLNLLRFKPDGGRERFLEYLGIAGPLTARHDSEVVYFGDGGPPLAAEPGQSWDAVALVRYPSRRAFANLVDDPDYQAADPVRMSALLEAVLQPLHDMSG